MFTKLLLKIDNLFIRKEKINSIFSSIYINKKSNFFTSKTSYTQQELNLFKTLFGRAILLNNTDTIEILLNDFFANLKQKKYNLFLSEILLSAFKLGDVKYVSKIVYIYNKNYISFYRDREEFYINCNKMFYFSQNNCKLLYILLNSNCFGWILRTFNFDRLIKPTIHNAVILGDYDIYNTILNSLTLKANYLNGKIIEEATYIALENGHFDFFEKTEFCVDLLSKKNKSLRTEQLQEFLIKALNKFIKENNETACFLLFDIIKKQRISIFLYYISHYNKNKIIDNIIFISSINENILKEYLNLINLELELELKQNRWYDLNENINSFKEKLFSFFIEFNNPEFFSHLFLPNFDFICESFKNKYNQDNIFLNYFYKIQKHNRNLKKLDKCIEISNNRNKIKSF
jgi:hypothetical protein